MLHLKVSQKFPTIYHRSKTYECLRISVSITANSRLKNLLSKLQLTLNSKKFIEVFILEKIDWNISFSSYHISQQKRSDNFSLVITSKRAQRKFCFFGQITKVFAEWNSYKKCPEAYFTFQTNSFIWLLSQHILFLFFRALHFNFKST